MYRRLISLLVTLAVLPPGLGSTTSTALQPDAVAHACCLKMQGCRTLAWTCCSAPERGRESTAPAPGLKLASPQVVGAVDVLRLPAPAHIASLDAHALARANAPPDPLYLKHLTLLV